MATADWGKVLENERFWEDMLRPHYTFGNSRPVPITYPEDQKITSGVWRTGSLNQPSKESTMPIMSEKKKRYSRKELMGLAFPGTPEIDEYRYSHITTYKEAYEYFKREWNKLDAVNKELRKLAYTSHTGEKYKDLYKIQRDHIKSLSAENAELAAKVAKLTPAEPLTNFVLEYETGKKRVSAHSYSRSGDTYYFYRDVPGEEQDLVAEFSSIGLQSIQRAIVDVKALGESLDAVKRSKESLLPTYATVGQVETLTERVEQLASTVKNFLEMQISQATPESEKEN